MNILSSLARRSWFAWVALAASLAVALGAGVPAQAGQLAPGEEYVALGDSYASGVGAGGYINDGTTCQRSTAAYPSMIAAARAYTLNFRACSGATVPTVRSSQLSALSASTDRVTISVGGNDAGFVSVITQCLQPAWMSDCMGAVDGADNYIRSQLPATLDSLYAEIRNRAPNAQVVVVGYPRLFNGRDCHPLTWFSGTEMSRLNGTADLLNQVTARAAAARGFTYSEAIGPFAGHALCDSAPWLNNLSWTISDSFHPNKAGHQSGYLPSVSRLLTGTSIAPTPLIAAISRSGAEEQAELQAAYAEVDKLIRPERVKRVDLSTKKAVRAAKKAGVDLTDRASIDKFDRIYSKRQAKKWRQAQ